MVRMQWWAYLLMLMVYICYLLIGAAVFQKLESPFEEKRCKDAKAKVKDKKEEFGNEVLTLNLYWSQFYFSTSTYSVWTWNFVMVLTSGPRTRAS